MGKYSVKKLISTACMGILTPIIYFIHNGYTKSTEPSNFELAASRLGFNGYTKEDKTISKAQQQEALLTQLQIAGYFQLEKLWQDINRLGVKDPVTTFKQIYPAIKKSKADQSNPRLCAPI